MLPHVTSLYQFIRLGSLSSCSPVDEDGTQADKKTKDVILQIGVSEGENQFTLFHHWAWRIH